ncbi:MAG TPA: hypothetical protein VGY13_13460, partial [Solirubrobacteraceae bacterium]|nr:hypothetical protein [Solirubrobacteraceae bacterium]
RPPRGATAAIAGAAAVAAALLVASLAGAFGARHASASAPPARHARAHPASAASPSFKPESKERYGGLPSWLPKPKVHVNRVVPASPGHPALAIQGDSVQVELPQGRALATAVGPETPEQGKFPVPATSPCTFVVTFSSVSGTIPISPRAFAFLDEQGNVRHPRVTALGGGPAPSEIVPGRPVSLKVYDILPTGDGGLTWTPTGARPVVAWDFDVEID